MAAVDVECDDGQHAADLMPSPRAQRERPNPARHSFALSICWRGIAWKLRASLLSPLDPFEEEFRVRGLGFQRSSRGWAQGLRGSGSSGGLYAAVQHQNNLFKEANFAQSSHNGVLTALCVAGPIGRALLCALHQLLVSPPLPFPLRNTHPFCSSCLLPTRVRGSLPSDMASYKTTAK